MEEDINVILTVNWHSSIDSKPTHKEANAIHSFYKKVLSFFDVQQHNDHFYSRRGYMEKTTPLMHLLRLCTEKRPCSPK